MFEYADATKARRLLRSDAWRAGRPRDRVHAQSGEEQLRGGEELDNRVQGRVRQVDQRDQLRPHDVQRQRRQVGRDTGQVREAEQAGVRAQEGVRTQAARRQARTLQAEQERARAAPRVRQADRHRNGLEHTQRSHAQGPGERVRHQLRRLQAHLSGVARRL